MAVASTTLATADVVVQQTSSNTLIPALRGNKPPSPVGQVSLRDADIQAHAGKIQFGKCPGNKRSGEYEFSVRHAVQAWVFFQVQTKQVHVLTGQSGN
ncbi:hypothetical protein D3C73_1101160 [compost metagenome]